MIVVEETGVISFFYIRPYEDASARNRCFARILNLDESGSLRRIASVNF